MVMSLRVFGKESRRNQEQLSKYCDQEYKWIHSTKGTSLNPHAYKIIYPIQGPNDLNQSSAAIYFANHSPTNHSVVIKITDLESEESFQLLLNEIDNFRKVRHSNLLPLLATFVRDGQLWNVMTSAQYGSVDIWSKPSGLPELAIAFIIKDVLAGLNYLHKRGKWLCLEFPDLISSPFIQASFIARFVVRTFWSTPTAAVCSPD